LFILLSMFIILIIVYIYFSKKGWKNWKFLL
jgi:hypothetical protein